METIAAPTVEKQQPRFATRPAAEDEATTAERRELVAQELRAAIRRKLDRAAGGSS